jgi:bifunctional non-homologous end joining protein LigD
MKSTSTANVEGREVELSNLTKVLWPDDNFTKAELINYYAEIYPWLAPHLKDRPLVFTRYPNGIKEKFFYQKNVPDHLPVWIKTFNWQSKDRIIRMLVVTEKADLVWLANLACIELHPWLSRQQTIYNPDYMIFDLDPSPANNFEQVRQMALALKEILDALNLRPYLKTSGAEGLHLYVPLQPVYSYEQVRQTAGSIAQLVCRRYPDIATVERSVSKRGNKIYIDYMQNVIGKTICAPYSVRPRPSAPVSVPLAWDELSAIKPSDFNIKNVLKRLNQRGDLFQPVLKDQQVLKAFNLQPAVTVP